jgi:hypothetical protein
LAFVGMITLRLACMTTVSISQAANGLAPISDTTS